MQYKIIKNFLDKKDVEILVKNIYQNTNSFIPCQQCEGSVRAYNFKPAVWILASKTKEISEAVGERVLPSYCYTRIYKHGTELVPHVDRPACEITATVHLYGDKPWDLVVKEDEEEKIISLEVGDAAVYDGVNNSHWREGKYPGDEYINTFLHYVRMSGEHSNLYFEKLGV